MFERFRSLFTVPTDNPELVQSQVAALSRQIPLLYIILLANTFALAITHIPSAPPELSIIFPLAAAAIAAWRIIVWWQARSLEIPLHEAVRRLRTTVRLVLLLGASFTTWGLLLLPYGDAYAQGHVAFYMAITVVSCIFCLMHLRPAALLLTVVVLVPYVTRLLLTGNEVFIALALNVTLVTVAMVVILFIYYRDFANLIGSQKALQIKQAETQRLSDENLRLANLDSLTELPNRRRFFTELETVVERAAREGGRFAVAVVDLDGFKPINDLYGHATGDRVLIEAAHRIGRHANPSVLVARLGGDEFGLVIGLDLSDGAYLAFVRGLCQILQASYVMPDIVARMTGSVGIAVFPDAGLSAQILFERADYALYYAKQHHRGEPVMFSAEHESEIRNISGIEQALRHADLDQELSLAFQPLVDVERRRTLGFEALARWTSPSLGPVSPALFIRIAERSELIHQMTRVLLRKALVAMATWPEDLRVSFNLSTRDIGAPEVIRELVEMIVDSGIDTSRIDLEITETAVMSNFEEAREALVMLKAQGLHISLDDFGTGYSSLSYVHRLPLDKIKIDRSFITEVETNPASRNIVKSMVDLCRNLNLTCVVEGTETRDQIEVLRGLGCQIMQGYAFARPMPAAAIEAYLQAERQVEAAGP